MTPTPPLSGAPAGPAVRPEPDFVPAAPYVSLPLPVARGLRAADRMRAAGHPPGPLLLCPRVHRTVYVLLPPHRAPGARAACPRHFGRVCTDRLWLLADGAADRLTDPGVLYAVLAGGER